MEYTPRQLSLGSPVDLMNAARLESIHCHSNDPLATEAVDYFERNVDNFISLSKDQKALWQCVYDEWIVRNHRIDFVVAREECGFTFEFRIVYDETGPRVYVDALSTAWARARQSQIDDMFAGGDEDHALPIFSIAKRIGVGSFQTSKAIAFNAASVTDRLGKGLDTNIIELVKWLNAVGLRTTSSCGGHEDGRRPYIHFHCDNMEQVVALFVEWEGVGGLPYRIMPLGHPATEIRIEAPEKVQLSRVQNDLARLTDFVGDKAKAAHSFGFGVSETIENSRHTIGHVTKLHFPETS